tara:strand:+ start:1321 stop:2229 length:909 start_codon:yes stop_codon:yes gene_type:complete
MNLVKPYFNSIIKKKRNKLNSKFIYSENIGKKELFELRKKVLSIFSKSENKEFKNFNKLMEFLNKTKVFYLKKDLDLMVELESYLIKIFKKKGLINSYIKGIEFPINIRIVHPERPKKFKSKYDTGSIHCDPWAGEPSDLVNIVLYLEVNEASPRINIFNIDERKSQHFSHLNNYYKNKFFLNTKKYFQEVKKIKELPSFKLQHKNGNFFIFNCFTPHNSIRHGKRVRLSLEFRLRLQDPYKSKKYWLNKTNRRGRYWYIPKRHTKSFEKRLSDELNILKREKNHSEKINLRKKEVKTFLQN